MGMLLNAASLAPAHETCLAHPRFFRHRYARHDVTMTGMVRLATPWSPRLIFSIEYKGLRHPTERNMTNKRH